MGLEWQKGLISELKHCGDLNQSNNMSIETESEGKCCFVPALTLHGVITPNANSFRFRLSQHGAEFTPLAEFTVVSAFLHRDSRLCSPFVGDAVL